MDDEVVNPDPDALRSQAEYLSDEVLAEFQARGAGAFSPEVWQIVSGEISRRAAAMKSGEESIAPHSQVPSPSGPLVTAFTPTSPSQVAMAKAVLEGEGIPCVLTGEFAQNLLGLGTMFGGYNQITGPVRIEVAENHLALARDLLSYIED